MKRLFLLTALLCGLASLVLADPVARFDEGMRRYQESERKPEQLDAAIDAWEGILREGQASGPTYFNLGNAYFRKADYGRSILNYERARQFLPRDRDLMANLDEARRRIVDRIEPPLRLAIWDWADEFRDSLTLRELAVLLQVLGVLGSIAVAIKLFRPLLSPRLVGRIVAGCLILFISAGGWYVWRAASAATPSGVVMVEKTDVYSAPDNGSKELFALHNGTTVRVGESLAGWTNIRLIDGRQGWIAESDLERI